MEFRIIGNRRFDVRIPEGKPNVSILGWIKLGAAIALVMFAIGYYKHVENIGYKKHEAEVKPLTDVCDAKHLRIVACAEQIDQSFADVAQLKINNDGLQKTINEQNLSLTRLADAASKAKAAAAAAMKQSDEDAVFYTERLKGLQQHIDHPAQDPNADADHILRALAIDRRLSK